VLRPFAPLDSFQKGTVEAMVRSRLVGVVDGSLGLIFAEEVVEVRERDGVVEAGHGVFAGHEVGGLEEAGPCSAGEGGPYGDAANSEGGEFCE